MILRSLLMLLFFVVFSQTFTTTNLAYKLPIQTDMLSMDGILLKHLILNSADSLSSKELLELQDEKGLTVWYARFFHKDICVSGLCQMAKFWIFWDGKGDYIRYQLEENDSLTKAEHVAFQKNDYIRLHEILSDTESILKDLAIEDLDVKSDVDKSTYNIDGYSGATPPVISEYVVKDAVYTCYTLWHTVYGETNEEIQRIIDKKVNSEYIERLLSGNDVQKLSAIKFTRQNLAFFYKFENTFLELITSKNEQIAENAIALISLEYWNIPANQEKLVQLIDVSLPQIKYEVIYKLQLVENISEEVLVLLLDKFIAEKIDLGGYNQFLRVLTKQVSMKNSIIQNNEIKDRLDLLTSSPNTEMAKLTKIFLGNTR